MDEQSKEIPEEELQDYFVPVSWGMCGYVIAKGIDSNDAYLKVKNHPEEYPLPNALESNYLDESFCVSYDTDEGVKPCN